MTQTKNIIFIPAIAREKGDRHLGYKYGIASWKKWAEKNNAEVFVMDKLIYPEREMLITWQRWYVFDILEANGIDTKLPKQILVTDADTIIHPNCPNFFNMTDMKYSAVNHGGDFEWVARSIKNYSKYLFNSDTPLMRVDEYLANGFVVINETHRELLSNILKMYHNNAERIVKSYEVIRTGKDQTVFNILRYKSGVKYTVLPREYSLQDLNRKNLLYTDSRYWFEDSLENLYQSGWIYQFNAIPENEFKRYTTYWMERIYKELYGDDIQ